MGLLEPLAMPCERSAQRIDQANGYKSKTTLTRMGEITFEVPQVGSGSFYPSALERGSRSRPARSCAAMQTPAPPENPLWR
jgi:transposase-like protein